MNRLLTKQSLFFPFLLFFLLLLTSQSIYSQNLLPKPDTSSTRFFYRDTTGKVTSVSIGGSFNEWDKTRNRMTYDPRTGVWSGTVPTIAGVEYSYKLVLNDSLWITDPNAPDMTEDEWRNGIIVPQEYGKPYIRSSFPALNKRVIKIDSVYLQLESDKAPVDTSSIKIVFNGIPMPHFRTSLNGNVALRVKEFLNEGENKLVVTFADLKGNCKANQVIKFFYDIGLDSISTPCYFNSSRMYEVYLRSFGDSVNLGGFKAITKKLEYLKDTLGVNILWLMPFQESNTEHGYNVTDYYKVEKDYGTREDYLNFIRKCKEKNIKVLMDFVINHTDSTHEYFLDAYHNPGSKYSSWYQFTNMENTDWYHFGVERKMPKLNFDNRDVQDYFIKIALYWMDPLGDGSCTDGIDGFRCDAAKEIPHSFWNRFRSVIKSKNRNAEILGEVWDNANFLIPFYKNEFDALFNYPLLYALDEYINRNDISALTKRFHDFSSLYPAGYQMVTFLANHDNSRAASRYSSPDKYKLAMCMLFTLPGTPMIYYGDEIGMAGKAQPPENVRLPINWSEVHRQIKDSLSILTFHRKLISLRNTVPALSVPFDRNNNSLEFLSTDAPGVLAYLRRDSSDTYIAIVNNTGRVIRDINVELPSRLQKSSSATEIFSYNAFTTNVESPTLDIQGKFLNLHNKILQSCSFLLIKITH
ncbi:MAG: hypothetical protein LWX56_14970 [Ignavibacteria bacterium]|nr:hypothetical protein [Ignavibacteria bacterium]